MRSVVEAGSGTVFSRSVVHYNRGGDFTFTHPGDAAYLTPEVALVDAVRRELGANPVELIVPAAGDLADAAGTDAMWLTCLLYTSPSPRDS